MKTCCLCTTFCHNIFGRSETMLAVVLTFIIILPVCLYIFLIYYHWRAKKLPYSIWMSIKGSFDLFFMKISLGTFCNDLYKKTKDDYIGFHIFGRPGILIRDLGLIKQVLVKNFEYFPDRTITASRKVDPLGSRVLFTEKNPVWKFMRSKIAPAFSTGRIKFIYPHMITVGDNFVEYIIKNSGRSLDIRKLCSKYTMDIIKSCAFDIQENSFKLDKPLSEEASRRLVISKLQRTTLVHWCVVAPFFVKLFGISFLDPSAVDYIRDMYEEIKKKRKSVKFRNDYVGHLIKLEERSVFHTDPKEIFAQVLQFFLAGSETIPLTMLHVMYELAQNQDIQDKLRVEIQEGVKDENGELTYGAILDMKYLAKVVNETLRKHPLVPFLDRRAVEDYRVPNSNIVIEKGTNVYISVQGIHRDPKYFPEPLKFDPERFSDENKDKLVHNSYIPFGDGPRNCIGARFGKLSVLVGIAKIVEKFRISGDNFEEFTYDSKGFLLSPDHDVFLTFNKI